MGEEERRAPDTQTVTATPTRGSHTGVEGVAAAMMEDLDAISRRLADAIHEQLDELDEDMYAGTLGSTRSNVGMILTMLSNGTPPTLANPPADALAYAKDYVHQGLSLQLLLRAYRTAQAPFARMWLERLREQSEAAADLARSFGFFNDWLFAWVAEVERRLTDVYVSERERWVRGTVAMRAEEVRAILEDLPIDVMRTSARLRYDLEREHVAYIIWTEHPDGKLGDLEGHALYGEMERLAAEVAETLGASDCLTVPLGRHLTCWAGSRSSAVFDQLPAGIESATHCGLHITFGSPARGLEGFRRSHREALRARRVARLARHSPGSCVGFSDVALDALLTEEVDEARRFVQRELGSLADDSETARRLRATLVVFFDEKASFVHAAHRLGVHENTIAYRVRSAEERLGRRIGDRQLELMVALRLARLTL